MLTLFPSKPLLMSRLSWSSQLFKMHDSRAVQIFTQIYRRDDCRVYYLHVNVFRNAEWCELSGALYLQSKKE